LSRGFLFAESLAVRRKIRETHSKAARENCFPPLQNASNFLLQLGIGRLCYVFSVFECLFLTDLSPSKKSLGPDFLRVYLFFSSFFIAFRLSRFL